MGKTSTFERIAASVPVNAQAARQIGHGEVWEPAVKIHDYSRSCPKLRKIDCSGKDFVDFTGENVGRLTVIGLRRDAGSDGKARWVCRCTCGGYCTRSSRSMKIGLRGGNSFIAMCGLCSYQIQLREQTLKGMRNDLMRKVDARVV